ncbi:single-stranded DNA-binding protein [Candidatus Dependentiae bacterium]|nr:single-stranded DNA-binding protein [Candidatus Dependentiae bacterium]
MAGYNRIIMVGNLTRDPELKQLPSGQSVCRLGLASNRQFKNKQTGTQMQEVCYIDIDVWGVQAESCQKFLSKGRPVLVEGRLKLDSWQDQQGANRSKHSIIADRVVFLASTAGQEVEDSFSSQADVQEVNAEKVSFTTQGTAEFSKIEQELARKKMEKKQAEKKTVTKRDQNNGVSIEGVAHFKDEAPFEDDLPF